MLVDMGTNGEIVIGNKDWLVCCSASAGPAFEGGGISCGMRATNGAIEHIVFEEGCRISRVWCHRRRQAVGVVRFRPDRPGGGAASSGCIDRSGRLSPRRAERV